MTIRQLLLSGCVALTLAGAMAPAAWAYEPRPRSDERTAILKAIRPNLEADVGDTTVAMTVEYMNIEGDWAYARVTPVLVSGPVDWARTRLAARHAATPMKSEVLAILRKQNDDTWALVEYLPGATAADRDGWIAKHKLDRAVLGSEAGASAAPAAQPAPPPAPQPAPPPATPQQAPATPDLSAPLIMPKAAMPPPPAPADGAARDLSARGDAALAAGDTIIALSHYSEAIALQPANAVLYRNRARVWTRLNDHDKALADLDTAIRLDPQFAAAYNNRGSAFVMKKDDAKALADFTAAISFGPAMWQPYANRGRLHYRARNYEAAIADFDRGLAQAKEATLYRFRADAYYASRKFGEAVADYTSALAISRDPLTLINRSEAQLKLGRAEAALVDATAAIEIKDTWPARLVRAEARFALRTFDEAMADADIALRDQPNNARLLALRSAIWQAKGDGAHAEADLAAARRINPDIRPPALP